MLKSSRIESIDLLRGIVMIFMALDHVRDYFHADAFVFDPTDLSKTSVLIFFTRWITHYCAPVFVFLTGTSAFIVGSKKGKKELSAFLLKRGLWLIFLELTVVNFSWFFNIHFPLVTLIVIWALGVGMVVLSAFIHLNWKLILAVGLLITFGHNAFDNFHVTGNGAEAIGWSLLHEFGRFPLGNSFTLFVGYPIVPWIGVMLLGYCFGNFYLPQVDSAYRKKMLLYLSFSAITLFIVIRFINGYGDSKHWSMQESPMFTVLSFLNVSKYPPSLLYVLMTLGPALLFLSLTENINNRVTRIVVTFGRVPMFYYLLHIYLIHGLAMISAIATGYQASDMIFNTWVTNSPNLKGYGFSLGIVYLVWIGVVVFLYPLCKWYDNYKLDNRDKWWLSYL